MNIMNFFAGTAESPATDMGLLLLRVCFGLSLFLKHGWEKITGLEQMAQWFPDPFHIGTHASLAIATASDAVAAVLLIAGLATRPAALFIFCNISVAWIFVHHFEFFGRSADHGELCVLYLGGMLAILFCDGGRLSLDAIWKRTVK
jgi:putative oxidoreductase